MTFSSVLYRLWSKNHLRNLLNYAVCMKGEVAEAIVKILTDAKADEQIKDINGLDVTAMKADPLDMEAFVASYESNLLLACAVNAGGTLPCFSECRSIKCSARGIISPILLASGDQTNGKTFNR